MNDALPGEEILGGATISAHLDDGIGWVVLGGDRPFVIDERFPAEFIGALDAVEAGRARAVILAGTTKVFCAGADLRLGSRLQQPEFARDWLTTQHKAVLRLVECPLPTVAAVHGAAAGAGCNLALACDQVLADPAARFSQAFIRIGLATDMGSVGLVSPRTGVHVARELMLSGREVSGEEALVLRLADELCPAERLWSRVREVAVERSQCPLAAYGAVKEALAKGAGLPIRESLELELELQLPVISSPDFAEGTSAFLEKRPPVFGGARQGDHLEARQ